MIFNLMTLGQTQMDPLSIIFQILFFVLIFISMFYGTKIQAWRSSKEIETGLAKLKEWNDECKQILLTNFKKYADKKETDKDLMLKLEDFLTFVAITPISLDPYGIVPKIDHIIDVRDNRFKEEVKMLAPNIDSESADAQNLENLLEATMAVDFVYRLVKHYLILGKKSKSYILLMQISMQMSLILSMAKSYYHATKAFAEGSPIGDALGPMVVGNFIRSVSLDEDVEAVEIAKDTIVQEVNFEDRIVYVVRAKGPGGTVGKPGTAIKKLIEEHGATISRIIMIDAGLKLSGDKSYIDFCFNITANKDIDETYLTLVYSLPASIFSKSYLPGILEWSSPWEKPTDISHDDSWSTLTTTSQDLSEDLICYTNSRDNLLAALMLDGNDYIITTNSTQERQIHETTLCFSIGNIKKNENKIIKFKAGFFNLRSRWKQISLEEIIKLFQTNTSIKSIEIKVLEQTIKSFIIQGPLYVISEDKYLANSFSDCTLFNRVYSNKHIVAYQSRN